MIAFVEGCYDLSHTLDKHIPGSPLVVGERFLCKFGDILPRADAAWSGRKTSWPVRSTLTPDC
jgi:hypothetical protein